MPITRDNHYVPIWYQRGFLEPNLRTLAYRDLQPTRHRLPDGSEKAGRSRFRSSPKQCFVQRDLYTTVLRDIVTGSIALNDEIETMLFGGVDTAGAPAVKAFTGTDVSAWHEHFQTLFRYIDFQKLRTPKGLQWLSSQYPRLTQNELMEEMEGIQAMHCTIWTEGVREIVSAEDADAKFIVSDHPVTIYNHALPPEAKACQYPLDPSITLKGSQTIFPLDRDHCLILTNLEYAKDHDASPLEKRKFARHFRNSMVRTDTFITARRLTSDEVRRINRVITARAHRYLAAGREEWLDPEGGNVEPWSALADTLLPPADELWRFGGETYASYEDSHVHYQDAFGRTEKESDFLKKEVRAEMGRREACGCGSGKAFGTCCMPLPVALRPSWGERGVRERNLMFYRGMTRILSLDDGRDWLTFRQNITDEQIREVHILYRALWPIETDILQLLPKPDGRPRAVYTGSVHPTSIVEFALGAPLYFDELIVQSPFVHPAHVRPEYSPIDSPGSHHQEFIKNVSMFLRLVPLIHSGHVNMIPDPTTFDPHLRDRMMRMAQRRTAGMEFPLNMESRVKRLMDEDAERGIMALPEELIRVQVAESSPGLSEEEIDQVIEVIRRRRELDPLAPLQDGLFDGGRDRGQLNMSKMAPNFEMALYLAQATGASIVTDSPYRWREILLAASRGGSAQGVPAFAEAPASSTFGFVNEVEHFGEAVATGAFDGYPATFADIAKYLGEMERRGAKPNWEAHVTSRFARMHRDAQRELRRTVPEVTIGKIRGVFPVGGIQDNTVNRLLLMSSSECHRPAVSMAFNIEPFADDEVPLDPCVKAAAPRPSR